MMDMDPISIFYNGKLFWELIVGYTIHIICPTASYPGRRLKRVEKLELPFAKAFYNLLACTSSVISDNTENTVLHEIEEHLLVVKEDRDKWKELYV